MDVVTWLLTTAGGPLLVYLLAQRHAAQQRGHSHRELLGAVAIPFATNVLISAAYRWLGLPVHRLLGGGMVSLSLGPVLLAPFDMLVLLAVTAIVYSSISQSLRREAQLFRLPEAHAWPAIGAATAAFAAWTTATHAAMLPVSPEFYPALIVYGLTWPQLRRAVDEDERPHAPPWWTIGLCAVLLANPLGALFQFVRWGGAAPEFLVALASQMLMFAALGFLRHLARSPWAVFVVMFASALAAGLLASAAGMAAGFPR
ncbi:MAG: hypothetical protein IT548_08520 [Alphaproteobacteria bacterium]|nr:hypothetical protein [Alphaproteobacteria bacterium]